MPDFAVGTAFTSKDRVTGAFKNMASGATKFGRKSESAFNRANRAGGRFGSTLKNVATGMIAAFSVRQGFKFINDSIKLWNKQAEAVANVAATIKSTGGIAGRTLKQLTAEAANLQKKTFLGDETILKGVTAQLLTFTNVQGAAFDRAQKAAIDVTAKLRGLDANEEALRSTTIALAKALNDPVANLGALGRSGIQFSKTQKDMIKTLFQSGKMMAAQNIILKEIENQYGGTAEAIAKTNGGIERQFTNLFGDVREKLGRAFAPVKLEVMQQIKNELPAIIKGIDKLGPVIKNNIIPGIRSAIKGFKDLVTIIKFVSPLIKPIVAGFILWKASIIGARIALVGFTVVQKAMIAVGWIKYLWLMRAAIKKSTIAMIAQKRVLIFNKIAMIAMKTATILWTGITAIATAATWAWGAAMAFLTSPITLVILAVAALAAGIYFLVKNWDVVESALITGATAVGEFFKRTFFTIADVVLGVFANIAKGALFIASKIGSAIGFDTSGLDKMFDKITKLQKSIRKESFAGPGEKEVAPNSSQVKYLQEGRFQADINIGNLPKGSEVKNEKNFGFGFLNLNLLGMNL